LSHRHLLSTTNIHSWDLRSLLVEVEVELVDARLN
jgi:hypothetical protein